MTVQCDRVCFCCFFSGQEDIKQLYDTSNGFLCGHYRLQVSVSQLIRLILGVLLTPTKANLSHSEPLSSNANTRCTCFTALAYV